jgi:hypothetical protein
MLANDRAIIYVPGMKPKPPPEIHRARLWQALLEGLRRTRPQVAELIAAQPESFKLAAWAPLFYPEASDPAVDVPGLERLMALSGPEPRDLEEARHWHKALTRIIYLISDRMPFLIDWVATDQLKANLHDSLRYLSNDGGVAERIRAEVAASIESAFHAGQRILLIAHSLGSVIAWDVLWELSRRRQSPVRIDQLLTIGSPLGLNFMRHRLLSAGETGAQRYPDNIRRWYNLSAVGELTALDRTFADDYRPMLDHDLVQSITDHIDLMNYFRGPDGLNVHKCYGYMINPRTATVVADWWQEGDSAAARA